jgi:hypothetical protein
MSLKPIKGPASYPCPPGFNGRFAGAYRWFSGRPLNGHRYTDATGWRRATMATDLSGYASRYHRLAGWERFAYFRAPIMAMPYVVVATWMASWPQVLLVAIGLATLAIYRLDTGRARRRHRREVIEPVAKAVAKLTNSRHVDGHGWKSVAIPMDIRTNPKASVAIRLPGHWPGEDSDRKRLATLVANRLAMDNMAMAIDMSGQNPVATFVASARPPDSVDFLDMAMVDTPDTEVAVGHGADMATVAMSLALESPHAAIAGGSGAGKSELLAFMVGQLMRRGYGVACLDAKFTSHMWLRRVPGVLYASESEELHEALVWLDAELLRRARLISKGGNPDALVPLVAVLEEMNGASNRLRAYWREVKETGDPMMSPALTALGNLSSMGRELRMHILMAGQSLTGKATAGAENRENFGIRFLARATANQWKMLAPQIKPAPVKRQRAGRWHLVVGDRLAEFQAPFVNIKEQEARLIEWATGGEPIPDVTAMMLMTTSCEETENPRSETVSSPLMTTLGDYVQDRPALTLTQLQNWKQRYAAEFPDPVASRGRAGIYAVTDLDAFCTARGVGAL